uniref:PRKR-interacting protein 1 n=1 Tax=Aegilops tauschii TaxID=37682 RepID=N1QT86_AEGTA
MSDPGTDSNMQQLVPMAPPARVSGGELVAKASVADSGKQLVLVEGGGKSSGGVKLREDVEDIEVKLKRIMDNVPVRASNTSGSSAGSGSGDFHQSCLYQNNKMFKICSILESLEGMLVWILRLMHTTTVSNWYRQMRRREQDRITRMETDYEKRKQVAEFNLRREERLKAAEERTSKKRLKRQKKKQRKNEKRAKPSGGGEEPNSEAVPKQVEEPSDDDDDEGSDYEGDDKFKQCK